MRKGLFYKILGFNFIWMSTCLLGYSMSTPVDSQISRDNLVVSVDKIVPIIRTYAQVKALNEFKLVSKVNAIVEDPSYSFIPGRIVEKGDYILRLDDEELRYSYYAQKSTLIKLITQLIADFQNQFPSRVSIWKDFLSEYNIETPLPNLPNNVLNKERNYLSAKNILNTYYSLKQLEVKLNQYQFIAPFNGTVLSPQVNHQDYVSVGQELGEFIGEYSYKTDILIPLNQRDLLQIGNKVELYNKLLDITIEATIQSFSKNIEENSRAVIAYITFESNENCHNVMFDATIYGKIIQNATLIPRQYLIDNSVKIVTEDGIKELAVSILHVQDNHVVVQGLENATILTTSY